MTQKLGPDPSVLLQMIPPLTVQITRLRGNTREPIPMPVREGYNATGPGWTIEQVQAIDQEILDIAGGGVYDVHVVDSSEPTRKNLKWSPVFPVDTYGPSKMPTTLTGYVAPQSFAQPSPYQPPPPQPTYGGWQPPRPPTPIQGAYGQAPYGVPPGYGYGAQPSYGHPGYGYGAQPYYGAQAPHSSTSEVDGLKVELNNMKLAQIQADAARQLAEQQAQHRRELEVLRASPKNDERYEREREARERAERDATEARRAAEAATAAAQHRAEIEALKALVTSKPDASVEQLRWEQRATEDRRQHEMQMAEERRRADQAKADADRRFDQMAAELARLREAPRGPDPIQIMLEMRRTDGEAQREMARLQAEAQKETARLQTESARITAEAARQSAAEMRSHMVNPVEMARILQETAKSGDEVTRTMLHQFTDIMNLQQQATQNVLQLAPQGESIPGRVVNIAEKLADRFSTGDTQVKVTQAQAAKAHADAAKAQAEAAKMQMQGWQAPPPVASSGAAAGAPGAVPALPATGSTAPVGDGNLSGASPPVAPIPTMPQAPLRRGGRTDDQWFGVAVGDVMNLRTGAAMFLAAIAKDPPDVDKDGNPPGLPPDQAAWGLLVASQEITKQGITGIAAFEQLFHQQMYPDLVEILLPDVTTQFGSNGEMYKSEMLRYLNRLMDGLPLHSEEELTAMRAEMSGQGEAEGAETEEADATPANGNGASAPTLPAPPPTARVHRGGSNAGLRGGGKKV